LSHHVDQYDSYMAYYMLSEHIRGGNSNKNKPESIASFHSLSKPVVVKDDTKNDIILKLESWIKNSTATGRSMPQSIMTATPNQDDMNDIKQGMNTMMKLIAEHEDENHDMKQMIWMACIVIAALIIVIIILLLIMVLTFLGLQKTYKDNLPIQKD
jgi:hypothetical protein